MARLTPLFSERDIDEFYNKFSDQADRKFLEVLQYTGEMAVKIARENGRYNDITGNLRSSIGYAILKDGKVVQENYEEAPRGSDRKEGVKNSKRLIKQVAKDLNKGYALVVVAGMDYALFVESMDNKDVLSGAVTGSEKFLRDTLDKVIYG